MLPQSLPAQSLEELLLRSKKLAGLSLGELAALHAKGGMQVGDKGRIGRLIETVLGVENVGPGIDLPSLGLEIKTLPIGATGPTESTWVAMLPVLSEWTPWHESLAHAKLNRVLFIPIEDRDEIPLLERRVGRPFLFELLPEIDAALARDWDLFFEILSKDGEEWMHAHHGEILQVRPKGQNKFDVRKSIDADGAPVLARKRGTYLRRTFTLSLLQREGLI